MHGFLGPRGVSPATVDRDGSVNLIDSAAEVGADVVLMSVLGATRQSSMELFRMKRAAELHLEASAANGTVVRAAAFLETWTDLLRQTARRSGRPLVFGRGDNPINFVSVIDVAAVVERAATDASTRGQTLEISGPTRTESEVVMTHVAACLRTTAH